MHRKLDVLFVNPDSSAKAYQGLATVYSAIEPPTWSLLLAESCRSKGFGVGILDCDAEEMMKTWPASTLNEKSWEIKQP